MRQESVFLLTRKKLEEARPRAEALLERSVRRVDLTAQPKEFGGLYGTGLCEPEARVDQAIASTLKSPTKNGAGETPSRMKEVAVGREHLDAG
ncbi:MAG: hypothetical protein LAO09_21025 [Acidobacteriia bacterium]|nr:hypothetical protein [Terriglobia bacterium]